MSRQPIRYRSEDEDSARWLRIAPRPGDIVVSTRSKHGTTWVQMICALLVFQTADLPQPLGLLSPWVDLLAMPEPELAARLVAQAHRRILKTHTPLDGLPLGPATTYIVAARHPLDAAVSLYHQGQNIDRSHMRRLMGRPEPAPPPPPPPPLRRWLLGWIDRVATPASDLDSPAGVAWHLTDAWRRRDTANVVIVHYDDLCADLGGEMRRIARRLGIAVDPARWPELVAAAGFAAMRARRDRLIPDPGILRDPAAFFRRGSSGAGREQLTGAEYDRYLNRMAELVPPDLMAWLHRPRPARAPRRPASRPRSRPPRRPA